MCLLYKLIRCWLFNVWMFVNHTNISLWRYINIEKIESDLMFRLLTIFRIFETLKVRMRRREINDWFLVHDTFLLFPIISDFLKCFKEIRWYVLSKSFRMFILCFIDCTFVKLCLKISFKDVIQRFVFFDINSRI